MKPLSLFPLALLLVACGESGDSSSEETSGSSSSETTGAGYFIDSPVSGLNYTAGNISGETDSDGQYRYDNATTVTFSLGAITLPTVGTKNAIHVSDLFDGGLSDSRTLNLARLFMTLDSDADPDNGIQLSSNATSTSNTEALANIDFASSTFDADVANYLAAAGGQGTLVTLETAKTHITNTHQEAKDLNSGCGQECVPRAAFNNYIERVSPRFGESSVSLRPTISVTMGSDFPYPLSTLRAELFAVSSSNNNRCRIDWGGFRCADYGTDSQKEAQAFTIAEGINSSVSGNTVTFSLGSSINYNYYDSELQDIAFATTDQLWRNKVYLVHLYTDNEAGDFKTWWVFYTTSE